MAKSGFTITRRRQVVLRGGNEKCDTSKPEVVRLDEDFDTLLRSAGDTVTANVALRLARGLAGYKFVYQAALGPKVDLFSFMQNLLTFSGQTIAETRKQFAGRNVSAEIVRLFNRCVDALGTRRGPKPVYYVLYGHPSGTNAKTFDVDQITGRPQILLNLCRLKDSVSFEVAVVHETIHTLQNRVGGRLVDRVVHEGVTTFLSQVLREGTKDTEALMWSERELRAAKRYHSEILAEFRRLRDSRDESVHREFLQAGSRLSRVRGAPARSGYYVGWIAARAWSKKFPEKGHAALLRASPDEIFGALRSEQAGKR